MSSFTICARCCCCVFCFVVVGVAASVVFFSMLASRQAASHVPMQLDSVVFSRDSDDLALFTMRWNMTLASEGRGWPVRVAAYQASLGRDMDDGGAANTFGHFTFPAAGFDMALDTQKIGFVALLSVTSFPVFQSVVDDLPTGQVRLRLTGRAQVWPMHHGVEWLWSVASVSRTWICRPSTTLAASKTSVSRTTSTASNTSTAGNGSQSSNTSLVSTTSTARNRSTSSNTSLVSTTNRSKSSSTSTVSTTNRSESSSTSTVSTTSTTSTSSQSSSTPTALTTSTNATSATTTTPTSGKSTTRKESTASTTSEAPFAPIGMACTEASTGADVMLMSQSGELVLQQ
eukprot:TRINITY_DN5874_c0_g1_i2.p1 TRINITY_DN5874_c0_g1~~TRINITY_DN5874_c0_g1_i2.p1  ORF type:complete len:344 (-),score=39.52 TRINITY_DN5874_c0_g1_i2:146-1177(-)